jgi:uncharacterized protein (DUF2225 family)
MSEELKPLYDKKVNCPICTFSYTTKKIRSRFIRVEKIESDFLIHYQDKNLNPIFYEINICSKCGYAFSDTFSTLFSASALESIKSQITANWKGRDFSEERSIEHAVETYKLAILSAALKQEKNIVLAGISLRLAWLFRLLNDHEQEKRFMNISLEKYKSSYMETDFIDTKLTEMRVLYLIGELARRLELWEESVKYFSRVINHKNRAIETKLVEMAREQWYLIRENDKVTE